MKIKITVESWAVGFKPKKIRKVTAPLQVGEIKGFEDNRTSWVIEEVGENYAKLSFRRYDGTVVRTWELEKYDEYFFRPMSFDGGEQYIISMS